MSEFYNETASVLIVYYNGTNTKGLVYFDLEWLNQYKAKHNFHFIVPAYFYVDWIIFLIRSFLCGSGKNWIQLYIWFYYLSIILQGREKVEFK